MDKAFKTVTSFVNDVSGLLQGLVVLGIVVGILFDDYFGVIAAIGELMGKFGDAGFAGLKCFYQQLPLIMLAMLIHLSKLHRCVTH